jgi:hypothetical protein
MRRRLIFFAPIAIVGVALFVFIGGEIVKLLWNGLLPPLFGLPPVTFWQALGLLVLCRILFGGLGRHGDGRRMTDRMTPEERERFRRRIRERFGFGHGGVPPMAPEGSEGGPALRSSAGSEGGNRL